MIHITPGIPVRIGNDVSIGHMCLIHGCEIGDNTLIGMGSIIMDGTKIGKNCIVGAGALVTGGKEFGDGNLIVGSPAKAVRKLTPVEIASNLSSAKHYVEQAKEYAK